ncbi:regulatory ArsR family protein [Paenibacillus taihuensis]|uniref:Regulatory ArsR family protein n=1 Tax=Paenibacillus taihuensis TaxID=1156355 RepID=A0A3D9RN25_9BACL|nr:winged helix-turn-helix domain-containing protein [Paenibacillus taihuensis]REE81197.1 regulatory ArsR family protein [Paenibacillus taihuensis]
MTYSLDIRFKPLYEVISSLHAYICKKSHKKLDLTETWPKQARQRFTPELVEILDSLSIDGDWKLTYLLVFLCPNEDAAGFAEWLRGLTAGALYELMSPYGNQFPANMTVFRDRTAKLFELWDKQYFQHIDTALINRLDEDVRIRKQALPSLDPAQFVDETSNGLYFEPVKGLEKLVLMPQYHFQPFNVVHHYGSLTVCHYAARIDMDEDDFLSTHEYRMIRSVAERSRLKILRFLHKGPRSFIEIVRHLELSKGITHDHIAKLRHAGMLTAHFEGETLTVYSLRIGALAQMYGKLMEYIERAE